MGDTAQQKAAELMRSAARRLSKLQRRLSAAEELADRISRDLLAVAEAAEETIAGGSDAAPRRGWKELAAGQPVALNLEIKRQHSGCAVVRVDYGRAFRLSPMLGYLLGILAGEGGRVVDELAGWKSLDEVAILLGKQAERRLTRHAVTQQLYRLRRELFDRGGVSPALVQTHRTRGARLALKRGGVRVGEARASAAYS